MADKWIAPVTFETTQPGQYQTVVDCLEALQVLNGWWIDNDGASFRGAVSLCIAAMRGDGSAQDARDAFVFALENTGVRVLSEAGRAA